MEKKSYVVYNGRKNGVYTSWIDCYAQAHGYTDCVVRLYDSVSDGQNAWESYNLNSTSSLQTKRNIEANIFNGSGYMNSILSNIIEQTDKEEIVHDSLTNVLMKKDIQDWLRDACCRYHIEQPLYVLHDYKDDIDGKRYYRYRASLTTTAIGKPRVCLGNYARTHEKARDMVATMLLRRLLSATNHKLIDYNHHNVVLLEAQLERMADTNYELHVENTTLLAEVNYLTSLVKSDSKKSD